MECWNLIVSLISAIIAGVGLYLLYKQLKEAKDLKKSEFEFQVFIEYTKRYQEIILNFPENINDEKFEFPEDKKSKEKILRYMRAYFDLCSEEFYLFKEDNIVKAKHWKNWKSGMTYAFSKKAFKDSWKIINADTRYYKEFNEFVEQNILKEK